MENFWGSYPKQRWSELYVLLKLLGERVLYGADTKLQRKENLYYPIVKVLYGKDGEDLQFAIGNEITLQTEGFSLPVSDFKRKSLLLLENIKNAPESSQPFRIPEIEAFLKSIHINKLGADPNIKVVTSNTSTGKNTTLSFKTLSHLGDSATLLRSSIETNFIYELENLVLSPKQIVELNSLDQVVQRVEAIRGRQGKLRFIRTEEDIFGLNMQLIDSCLPEIIGYLLVDYYSSLRPTKLVSLLTMIEAHNPINYPATLVHNIYRDKIKKFLAEIAYGQVPSKLWDGSYDATTGCIVVREDGELLGYHVYNRGDLEEYLIKNTCFTTQNDTRLGHGVIYEEGNRLYIKLNLQIEFIK